MNLPMLDLQTREGEPVSWGDLWQRRNVLLLLAHPECPVCRRVLAAWSEQAPALQAENAVALAAFPAPPADVPEGIRVIVDPGDRLARHLGVGPGSVIAADRFFAVLGSGDAHAAGAEEAARDALDWIRLAERKCDECGVPTW